MHLLSVAMASLIIFDTFINTTVLLVLFYYSPGESPDITVQWFLPNAWVIKGNAEDLYLTMDLKNWFQLNSISFKKPVGWRLKAI